MLTDFGLSFFDLDFGAYSDLADNPHAHLFSADSSRYAPVSPKSLYLNMHVYI
jgi:hypothetical protein